MKKLLTILLLGCLLLVGCGAPDTTANPDTDTPGIQSFVGTWNGTYTYNGNEIKVNVTINEDYSYTQQYYVNGVADPPESGICTMDNGDILLQATGDEAYTRYKYENGTIVNNNHPLHKVN